MKIFNLLLLSSLLLSYSSFGQDNPVREADLLLQGFSQKVQGTEFRYHSAIEGIREAYLVRGTNGSDQMTWKTESVPRHIEADFVVFVWLAGLGSNLGKAPMYLSVDEILLTEFETGVKKDWDIALPSGGSLSFRTSLVDGANDLFGFMFLRLPAKQLDPGQPLSLTIRGGAANTQAWYMTFLAEIPTRMEYKAFPALYKSGGVTKQPLQVQIVHFGHPEPVAFYMNGKTMKTGSLSFGVQTFELDLDPVEYPLPVKIAMESRSRKETLDFIQSPVRKWNLSFVQHSHTDIGYTRPQDEILAEQVRFIDYALDYCDATDSLPDEARFRWTCEASFAVEDFLNTRSDHQINRLIQRIREGRIEVTGMYFNFDEMPDEHTLAASLRPLQTFKKYDIPVTTAMQNDVNGIGWCFADYFGDLGIKYLNMGTHGHRALICFDKPTPFWWESPSGNRVLTFRAEHYMTGNTVFGIHTGNFDYFEQKVMSYLVDLDNRGYPYDFIHIQHSGYQTDNSPPSVGASEMIMKWNAKYEWPKLKTANVSEFFTQIEEKYSDELPVYKAAWPDWWTDGFASGAREAAASRASHANLLAFHGALTMAGLTGSRIPVDIDKRFAEATTALLFYDEHTFGHSESVRQPFGAGTMEQRSMKESYAWEAWRRTKRVGEEAMGLLQEFVEREEVPVVALFNTMSFKRSSVASLYIDHQMLPMGDEYVLADASGYIVPAQPGEHRSDGTYWSIWTGDLAPYSIKKLKVIPKKDASQIMPAHSYQESETIIDLQNQWYYLQIDKVNGLLTKLIDNSLHDNLVDNQAPWGFGNFIYELPENRSELESFKHESFIRKELESIRFMSVKEGPLFTSVRFTGESEAFHGPEGFHLEIRLFNTHKQIDFIYTFRKKAIQNPESIYLAFPFNIPEGKIHFDVPGGTVEAGVDQIPGSTTDWNTIQNFVSISNGKAQVIVVCPEAPLMQLGGINTGRYVAGSTPEKTHIYGWPMNNYWVTNFNADQRGETTFTYSITTGKDRGTGHATRTGWNRRIPVLGRTLPPASGKPAQEPIPEGISLLSDIPEGVLVIAAIHDPEKKSIFLHLREIEKRDTGFVPALYQRTITRITETDANGNPIEDNLASISIKELESKFYLITYQ